MAWLSQKGIEFEERDITKNSTWVEELQALGSRATPTTTIESDGHKEVVIGFDVSKLEKLIG